MDIEAALARWRALVDEAVPCVAWSLVRDVEAGPWDSQVGGPGWGVAGEGRPSNAAGEPLLFVAQIALNDLPQAQRSPALDGGVVQIFVDADMMACAFPSRGNGNGFAIRHIPAGAALERLPVAPEWEVFQWASAETGVRLVPEVQSMWRSLEDAALAVAQQAVYDAVRFSGYPGQPWDHPQVRAAMDEVYEVERPSQSLHTGGVPGFSQGDPRVRDASIAGHTFVLLNIGYSDDFCVGDAGEWHILLRPEDWAAGKLDDAIYNWDCH